ncbi:OLC1v1037431C1 [Oldenlandia corymbosa var. corymbosa]|uniref:OLC1v1037431C1 n=1 Tax=Oldenlandia corymbosa var. corymbosa TaxID=529605 RepID=A0AAV1CYZ7_OLDCO|nr:OLC1v1037431C1 [Oldenlandia corymbosa var. corymbosa]
MEIEPSSPQVIGKKLWNIVRIVFYMMKKSKFMHDLHLMMKKGKLAGKAINNLLLHLQQDYAANKNSLITCRSSVDVRPSIVTARREYEFSCSNSPAYPSHNIFSKRKAHHYYPKNHHYFKPKDVHVVQKVFDILNSYEKFDGSSPMVALPGFGQSPMVRQLRVTDSPYPVKEFEENPQVDKDAEDFINKFYKELKQQRRIAAVESPSPNHFWGR